MTNLLSKNRGSILILALWALGLLVVFTIQIGMTLQDKIGFLSRADRKDTLRTAARAGVYKALSIIKNEPRLNKLDNPLQSAITLYYNPADFLNITLGQVNVTVHYNDGDTSQGAASRTSGFTDEERRLNLNTADHLSIQRLIALVTKMSDEDAGKIAGHIIDWRQYGETEIEGFFSDDQYENLEFPYKEKKALFETLDELFLVQGIDEKIYNSIIDYVTVYGGPVLNVNTASWQVLYALGFTQEQAKTIYEIRKGTDGIAGTLDDFYFFDINVMVGKLVQVLSIKDKELDDLNALIGRLQLSTEKSRIFRIYSQAKFASREENKSITCVFNTNNDKIMYWRER